MSKDVTLDNFSTLYGQFYDIDVTAHENGNNDLRDTAYDYASETDTIMSNYNDMTQEELNAKYLELWGKYVECLAELNS